MATTYDEREERIDRTVLRKLAAVKSTVIYRDRTNREKSHTTPEKLKPGLSAGNLDWNSGTGSSRWQPARHSSPSWSLLRDFARRLFFTIDSEPSQQ